MVRLHSIEKGAAVALLVAMVLLVGCGTGVSASALPTATSGSVRFKLAPAPITAATQLSSPSQIRAPTLSMSTIWAPTAG